MQTTGSNIVEQAPKDRQEKHIEIQSAIMHLNGSCIKLFNLIARIKGEPATDTEETAKEELESFSAVLMQAPGRIHSLAKNVNEGVSQLTDLLF